MPTASVVADAFSFAPFFLVLYSLYTVSVATHLNWALLTAHVVFVF